MEKMRQIKSFDVHMFFMSLSLRLRANPKIHHSSCFLWSYRWHLKLFLHSRLISIIHRERTRCGWVAACGFYYNFSIHPIFFFSNSWAHSGSKPPFSIKLVYVSASLDILMYFFFIQFYTLFLIPTTNPIEEKDP